MLVIGSVALVGSVVVVGSPVVGSVLVDGDDVEAVVLIDDVAVGSVVGSVSVASPASAPPPSSPGHAVVRNKAARPRQIRVRTGARYHRPARPASLAHVTRVPVGLLLWLTPAIAWAGNGTHPRTPVLWDDTPCLEVVDKSVDPIHPVHYDIPYEDTDVTPDEVDNSRRHQFFAFCRQTYPQDFLPRWITWADVDDATAHMLGGDPDKTDADVLETSTSWADCWHRLNADADRRPITFEQADTPVPWDTTDVPAGVYHLWGYTYEPETNRWWRSSSVVKVTDDGDPHGVGPAAAITSGEQILYPGDSADLVGCVDAMPGSTLTGYYVSTSGVSEPDWEPQWVPFVESAPVEGESFALEFVAPDEVAGHTLMMRVDVTDPMDRTYAAHMTLNVIVLGGGAGDCDTDGDFVSGAGCDDEDTGTTASPTTTAASSTTTDGAATGSAAPDAVNREDDGCGCRPTTSTPTPLSLLLLPLLFGRRLRSSRTG